MRRVRSAVRDRPFKKWNQITIPVICESHMDTARRRKSALCSSNAWAEMAGVFCRTRSAFLEHESAKAELKGLMPEDAKEAIGHGIRAKRSKSGAVSFDVLSQEAAHAPVQ
jgi:hypothetical protein